MLSLDPRTTALVLVDLQQGIVSLPLVPRSGAQVADAAAALARRFRTAGAPVVLVNVAFSPDLGDALRQPVDREMPRPDGSLPPGWSDLAPGLAEPGDIRVTKHQWGAFHGTDLDVHLRRRRVATVVLAGIATNLGVESTARQAYEHGYAVVIPHDATATLSDRMQAFAVNTMLPMVARVTTAGQVALDPATPG